MLEETPCPLWSSTETSRFMVVVDETVQPSCLHRLCSPSIFAELECYFVDRVVIGDDIYSLGYPSSFTSSSLVFLLCPLFPYSFLFTSSILNFLSHVSFEDLLQNSRGSTLWIRTFPFHLHCLPLQTCNRQALH